MAAPGFAQLVIVAVALVPAAPPAGEFVSLHVGTLTQDVAGLGTGGVGGTGYPDRAVFATDTVPPATLGWRRLRRPRRRGLVLAGPAP